MLAFFAIIAACDPLWAQIVSVTSPVSVWGVGEADRAGIDDSENASSVIANMDGMRIDLDFMVPPS
jgi:hypothetical protein